MKKILSLALAAAMMVSAIPAAYALEGETTYDNNYEGTMGTVLTLNGSGTEEWTVTVPAKMVPGDTGTVKAEGTWAADKFLQVKAPSSVTLTYGAQSMDVGITFNGLYKIGNSVDPVTASQDISVAEASRLFGTWTGTLTYEVDLVEKGDVNRDGVIDAADLAAIREMTAGTIEKDLTYADVHENESIDNGDIILMKRILGQNGIEVTAE